MAKKWKSLFIINSECHGGIEGMLEASAQEASEELNKLGLKAEEIIYLGRTEYGSGVSLSFLVHTDERGFAKR